MDFSLGEEQRLFRDSVRSFAERHLKSGALARAHAVTYPWEVAALMAEQGLLGITMSEADGGATAPSRTPLSPSRKWRAPARAAPTWCRPAHSAPSGCSPSTAPRTRSSAI